MLEVKDTTFGFENKKLLNNINLKIPEGTIFSFVGPNGAGKTTLLKLIAGIYRPWEGEILWNGKSLNLLSTRNRARFISYVPQNINPALPFLVEDVICMGRYPHSSPLGGISKNKELFDKTVMYLGIEAILKKPFSSLSGGEQRMVLIARALLQDTPVILLDETGTFLDLKHINLLLNLILNLKEQGKTMVMVTHDLNTASLYSDAVAIMYKGEIKRSGNPEDILTYKNIQEYFGVEVYYTLYPGTKKPVISLLRYPIPVEEEK